MEAVPELTVVCTALSYPPATQPNVPNPKPPNASSRRLVHASRRNALGGGAHTTTCAPGDGDGDGDGDGPELPPGALQLVVVVLHTSGTVKSVLENDAALNVAGS